VSEVFLISGFKINYSEVYSKFNTNKSMGFKILYLVAIIH
jgi:hypothetical protein